MPTEYYVDAALVKAVQDVVTNPQIHELAALRDHGTTFLVCAVRQTDSDDITVARKGPPVVVRKISAADRVFQPDDHYKVYVDMHRWEETNDAQHAAMIHQGLLRIDVKTKKDGQVKYGTRPYDIQTYHANVVRYGPWEETLLRMRDDLNAAKNRAALLAADAESVTS